MKIYFCTVFCVVFCTVIVFFCIVFCRVIVDFCVVIHYNKQYKVSFIKRIKKGRTMKVITVANRKGGVGKTTTAFNLAHSFARDGKRVCLMDLDGQGNLSVACRSDFLPIADFVNAKTTNIAENLDLISACEDFKYLEKIISDELSPTTFIKTKILPKIDGYDYLILDTSPSNNLINSNGYLISDIFLVVMLLDFFSVRGLASMTKIRDQIKEINPNVELKIVINQYRKNRNLNKKIEPHLESLKDMFTNICIPDKQIIKEDLLARRSSINSVEEYSLLAKAL